MTSYYRDYSFGLEFCVGFLLLMIIDHRRYFEVIEKSFRNGLVIRGYKILSLNDFKHAIV